jgi:hypothetical protein
MKRKRTDIIREPPPRADAVSNLCRLCLGLEPIADTLTSLGFQDIVGARDGQYTILTTASTLRHDLEVVQYMLATRGDGVGRRSFVAGDGHTLAVDISAREHGHSRGHAIWFFDGVVAHCIEEGAEDAVWS